MKATTKLTVILSILLILVLPTACFGLDVPAAPSNPAPTVDVAALAERVTARVQAQLPQQAVEVDPDTLRAAIEAVLEEDLPAVDAEALRQLVDEAVTAQLAQLDVTTPVGLAAAGGDGDLEATLVALYQQANPSVVYILTSTGSGSGFVYDTLGHIVTNRHVVSGSRQFEIVFADGTRLSGELIGADADSDLAVLKVDALPNPFGEQGSMSVGIVSGLGRSLRSQRTQGSGFGYSLPSVIQTDAPINPGNSGGPLLDLTGQVVGVNSAIASVTGVNSGVGFSIPVVAVRRIVPDLIEQGSHVYSYMGLSFASELSLSDQAQYGLTENQGAYILSLAAGSPADSAGLRAADPNSGRGGDLVIAIDGQPVRDFDELNSYLVFYTAPGQTIEMTVLRDGETLTFPLTLGARP